MKIDADAAQVWTPSLLRGGGAPKSSFADALARAAGAKTSGALMGFQQAGLFRQARQPDMAAASAPPPVPPNIATKIVADAAPSPIDPTKPATIAHSSDAPLLRLQDVAAANGRARVPHIAQTTFAVCSEVSLIPADGAETDQSMAPAQRAFLLQGGPARANRLIIFDAGDRLEIVVADPSLTPDDMKELQRLIDEVACRFGRKVTSFRTLASDANAPVHSKENS